MGFDFGKIGHIDKEDGRAFNGIRMKERGFSQILVVAVLATGLLATIYLVGKQTNIFPKASENISPSRIFVTSSSYKGDLGGVFGADAKCQERADAATLGGVWKVWISSDNDSPSSRLTHSSNQYKLINGTTVATSWTDLTDGTLLSPINVTENGTTNNNAVWTNTAQAGYPVGYSCDNWTSALISQQGGVGQSSDQSKSWTNSGRSSCLMPRSLYCIEDSSSAASSTPGVFSPSPSILPTPLAKPSSTPTSTFVPTPMVKPSSASTLPAFTNAVSFREYIFTTYGFTENAKSFIKSNSSIQVKDLSVNCNGGGGWLPWIKTVELNCIQYEAAVHELSHVWWHTYRLQNQDMVKGLARDVVRLADGDGPLTVSEFARGYVYGIGDWKGMYCGEAGCADPHNIKDQDFDFSGNTSNVKIIDWEIYAGLSSWTMGNFKTGSRALPGYMWKYFEPQFTGITQI